MSAAPIIERMKETLKTGKWWAIPWWRDEKYYKDGFASRKSAETAFRELIRTFDEKWSWYRKLTAVHPSHIR